MEYCPFAHRARLVLRAKGIPHDIVNINLINKPEWYSSVHPEGIEFKKQHQKYISKHLFPGKVPALDTGSKVVVESLDIADFLDEQYPEPPLYPAEPAAKEQDKTLIQKIGPIVGIFSKILFAQDKKTAAEWLKDFLPHLEVFEKELERRGTPFFGGEKPGMVNYHW